MNTVQMIPVDQIDPHPHNPRRDLGDLAELAKSIKAQGIRQNLLLVPKGEQTYEASGHDASSGLHATWSKYTAVIGHRRLAAARLAGFTTVPCVVDRDLTEAGQLELMLVENIQRSDLSAIEEAEGYQQLLDLGVTAAAIAKTTGRSPKLVRDRVKLLTLPEVARERIHGGQGSLLDAGKLEEFADDPDLQSELGALIGTANFSAALTGIRDTRKRRAAQQPIVDALLAKGAVELDAHPYGAQYITGLRSLDDVEKATVPEGAVFRCDSYDTRVTLYGPMPAPPTDEEKGALAAERAANDAAWMAERERRAADAAEAEACYKVRDEWIRERITGKFTNPQRALVAGHLGTTPLTEYVSTYTFGMWLGVKNHMDDKAVRRATDKWAAELDSAVPLLVFLHLAAGRTFNKLATESLYNLIEQLGYTISDAERSRISPATEEADEEDDDA